MAQWDSGRPRGSWRDSRAAGWVGTGVACVTGAGALVAGVSGVFSLVTARSTPAQRRNPLPAEPGQTGVSSQVHDRRAGPGGTLLRAARIVTLVVAAAGVAISAAAFLLADGPLDDADPLRVERFFAGGSTTMLAIAANVALGELSARRNRRPPTQLRPDSSA
jgi:hypothetical protein